MASGGLLLREESEVDSQRLRLFAMHEAELDAISGEGANFGILLTRFTGVWGRVDASWMRFKSAFLGVGWLNAAKSSFLAGLRGSSTSPEKSCLDGVESLLFSGEYRPSALRMRRLLGLSRVAAGLSGRLDAVLCSRGRKASSESSLRGCRMVIL